MQSDQGVDMSLMELEFGFKKKFILAKYGDDCTHCRSRKAKIYFEGGDQTTFVLCRECAHSWVRILIQDLISGMYPDVKRRTLVEMGVASQFMQQLAEDIEGAMSGEDQNT